MIFADVKDIVIPQGNVIKIHETASGRVLWEKKKEEEKKPDFISKNELFSNNQTFSYLYDNTATANEESTVYDHSEIHNNIMNGCLYVCDSLRLAGYNVANFEWYADYSTFPQGLIMRAKKNDSYLRIWLDVSYDGVIIRNVTRKNNINSNMSKYEYLLNAYSNSYILKAYCVSKKDKIYVDGYIAYENKYELPKVRNLTRGAQYDNHGFLVNTENTYQIQSITAYPEFYNFLQS